MSHQNRSWILFRTMKNPLCPNWSCAVFSMFHLRSSSITSWWGSFDRLHHRSPSRTKNRLTFAMKCLNSFSVISDERVELVRNFLIRSNDSSTAIPLSDRDSGSDSPFVSRFAINSYCLSIHSSYVSSVCKFEFACLLQLSSSELVCFEVGVWMIVKSNRSIAIIHWLIIAFDCRSGLLIIPLMYLMFTST